MDGIYRRHMPRHVFKRFLNKILIIHRTVESENFCQLYNLIEKNSQNNRIYYRVENFQDSDFENFIERKYWKQLIQHLVRYQQVRQVFESEC